MAGWMKTMLVTEVDLDPGHIVLYGVSAAAKGAQQPPPLFLANIYCGHGRPCQLLLSSCNYNDMLKMLGLQPLEERRMKSDLIETFKIVNSKYDINPELFCS